MNRIGLAILLLFSVALLKAQDIHFTQWMHAPHTYSPSSIGDFDGVYRFHGNYRNQWSSVTVPFVTFGGMAETNELNRYVKGLSGAAGLVYDITGDSKFSTAHLNFGAGYKIPVADSLGEFRVGIQPTVTQKKIDLDALKFDNQYNGYYFDENLETGENLPRLSRWYFDFALGAQFAIQVNDKWKLRGALAAFNLLNPKQSFFNNDDIRLDRRYSTQFTGKYKHSEKLTIEPGIQFTNQGTYYSVNFGSLVSYDLSKSKYFKQGVFAGAYFRAVDSGDLIFGLDYGDLRAGISYDINYSGLVPASNYRGGVELAVIYIIPTETKIPQYKSCPIY